MSRGGCGAGSAAQGMLTAEFVAVKHPVFYVNDLHAW
jgi:hypothetical protein